MTAAAADDEPAGAPPPGRRRPGRWLATGLFALVLIAAALAGVLRYGPLTDAGRQLIEARVSGLNLGPVGQLHVEGLEGDVWGDFTVRRLTVSDDHGVWLNASGLRVVWLPLELLDGTAHVELAQATRIEVLRRPRLAATAGGKRGSFSVRIDRFAARVATDPAFSLRQGLYDTAGSLLSTRSGRLAGRVAVASLTHTGDRLDAVFDLRRKHPFTVDVRAREGEGGAMAGALGLDARQPFLLSLQASGATSRGRFVLVTRLGATTPLQAAGAWTPQGGLAQGRIVLAASSLLRGWQAKLGPEARFTVSGARAAGGLYDLDVQAVSQNATVGARGLADLGRLTTGPDGLAVTLASPQPSQLVSWPKMGPGRFAGTVTGDASAWRMAGVLSAQGVEAFGYAVARASGPVSVAMSKGQATIQATLDGEGGQGAGLLAALLGGRPHAGAQMVRMADGRLLMKALAVSGPGLKLTGAGQVGILGGLSFKGDAVVTNLAAARAGATGVVSATWSASQGGANKPWLFTADAGAADLVSGLGEADRLLGPEPRLQAAASYDGKQMAVTTAHLVGAAGDMNAAGLIGGDGALKLKLDWRAKGPFDLGPLEIDGAAKGSGAITGKLERPRADLLADFQTIDLPGLELNDAHATLTFLKGPNDADGVFSLAATSPYGPAVADATFRLEGDGVDLTGVKADAGGAHAEGRVSLRQGQPSSASLLLSVGPGAFLTRGQAFGRLSVADAPGGARAELSLTAANAATREGGLRINKASLTAAGPLADMPYRIVGDGLTAHGAWKLDGGGAFSVVDADYGATFQGGGRLRTVDFKTLGPVELKLGPHGRSARASLDVGGGRANLDARQSGETLQAKADLTGVSLGLLDEDYTGRFDAEVSLNGQGPRLDGSLDAHLSGVGERGLKNATTIDGVVKARLAGDQVVMDANLGNAQGLTSQAHLVLPAIASAAPLRLALAADKPISGQFAAQGEVKPLWDLLLGGERTLAGQVQVRGALAGTLADPKPTGEAQLQNGAFNDSETGLSLRGVALTARLSSEAIDVSQFTGSDGQGGTVAGGGQISLAREGVSSFRLDLKGFRLIDNEIGKASASGQATINRAADGKVKLTGALTIDRADMAANPPTPSGVTTMDVVEINRPSDRGGHIQAETSHAPPIELDVSLKAGRNVFLKGRGLNLELALDAKVSGSTAAPALTGTAKVVRGDYDFAGKRFEFDNRGVINLAAAPEDIRLNLTATRDDPTLTAVIAITGTAAAPKIALSSTPVLPNDEVLSQVLFGSSAAQLSPMEGAELASALSAMAGGGGFDVLGNLRNFAHLDRLALGGGSAAQGVSVAGGKYLTDKVYLEIAGGGREGPSAQVEWRVKRSLSIVSKVAGAGGDSMLSVQWRKDY